MLKLMPSASSGRGFVLPESHRFLIFRTGYLMSVKQETDFGDTLEDKIDTKRRLTCHYRHANACNTPITKGLSVLPFKPLRYITDVTQVMLSSYDYLYSSREHQSMT